ncbi:hypothetical protein GMRT_11521 [Giardia muris]|uniref:Uncharacterized protein n=1 Tax=Giardia muris TaxID=5742 RepID=A0A4Z1SUN5_GIAMU|nr:hypothetical protein GMRT_11521 [Giardia muris]|eukprot:TNJ27318.1 hypothetical protein GMRT_11521 [Giardia muris]
MPNQVTIPRGSGLLLDLQRGEHVDIIVESGEIEYEGHYLKTDSKLCVANHAKLLLAIYEDATLQLVCSSDEVVIIPLKGLLDRLEPFANEISSLSTTGLIPWLYLVGRHPVERNLIIQQLVHWYSRLGFRVILLNADGEHPCIFVPGTATLAEYSGHIHDYHFCPDSYVVPIEGLKSSRLPNVLLSRQRLFNIIPTVVIICLPKFVDTPKGRLEIHSYLQTLLPAKSETFQVLQAEAEQLDLSRLHNLARLTMAGKEAQQYLRKVVPLLISIDVLGSLVPTIEHLHLAYHELRIPPFLADLALPTIDDRLTEYFYGPSGRIAFQPITKRFKLVKHPSQSVVSETVQNCLCVQLNTFSYRLLESVTECSILRSDEVDEESLLNRVCLIPLIEDPEDVHFFLSKQKGGTLDVELPGDALTEIMLRVTVVGCCLIRGVKSIDDDTFLDLLLPREAPFPQYFILLVTEHYAGIE